jgi:hypothetical protein
VVQGRQIGKVLGVAALRIIAAVRPETSFRQREKLFPSEYLATSSGVGIETR